MAITYRTREVVSWQIDKTGFAKHSTWFYTQTNK